MLKRHRSSAELLPHDLVELILEKLPVKSLLRFRCVSKKWKSSIGSSRFQERQFIRRQSRGPDVLFVSFKDVAGFRILLGSSAFYTVRFPTSCSMVCHGSCDGLLCFYCYDSPSFIVNPATRWHQVFPHSRVQQLIAERYDRLEYCLWRPKLGFGKDKLRGTYKPVWLYNSSDIGGGGLDTTCEVFDFSTNAWRYVVPTSPHRIIAYLDPVYLDGSLYWITDDCEEEPKLLSLDLHTETFQVVCKAPFAHVREREPQSVTMCILDNRLCVSENNGPSQVIWSFDGGSKSWREICVINLTRTQSWFGIHNHALSPIAVVEKNKLLLQHPNYLQPLVIYDLLAKSFRALFTPTIDGSCACVCYYQSLFSALSN